MQTLIACVLATALYGQPADTSPEFAPDRKVQLDKFAKDAAVYEITLQTPRPTRLTLLSQPVLNWDGSAFVWLRDGRPEVIGALWTRENPRNGKVEYGHAFQSLGEYPITAEFQSQLIWSPKVQGVKFGPVEGAAVPAADARARSAQMRALAREFTAIQWKGKRAELRMLTQPIFRYEPTAGRTKDGAIFAFTNTEFGTDPDALLLLESREFEGKLRWEYAFARFHYTEMSGNHRDKEVWRVEDEWQLRKQHVFGADPGRDNVYYSVLKP